MLFSLLIALCSLVAIVSADIEKNLVDLRSDFPNTLYDNAYFAMCLITKNDNLDLREWIEYHHRKGCDKFYISDHNSTVPVLDSILDYVQIGLVDYNYVLDPHYPNTQFFVYNRCIQEYGKRHAFMGFLDSDEFIVTKNESLLIPHFLKSFEDFGGLTLNWKVFGSSNHSSRPDGGILGPGKYTKCYPNHQLKTIVNTQYVLSVSTPHSFLYRNGSHAVDTRRLMSNGPVHPRSPQAIVPKYLFEDMYIHHYVTKSLEDFMRKAARGLADVNGGGRHRTLKYFDAINKLSVYNCTELCMPPPRPT